MGLVGDGPCRGELGWCQIAVGGVWSVRVVVDPPVLDQYTRFEEAVEPPQVQKFVAELTVERFDPRVLPRRSRVDEHGIDGVEPTPIRDGACDEFRAVVEPDVLRYTTLQNEPVKDGDDLVGVDPTVDEDRR